MTSQGTVTDSTYRNLPTNEALEKANSLSVKDEKGTEVPFTSLYAESADINRTFIIFIRHFFCGACEEYVKAVQRALTPERLAASHAKIVFVGCGGADLITDYKTRNQVDYAIYADPSLELFDALAMPKTTSPFMEGLRAPKVAYHDRSYFNIVYTSIVTALGSGTKATKAGPSGQNGGVVVLRGGQVTFCHCMRNAGDYLDIAELEKLLEE